MKQGKKLSRRQKEILVEKGANPKEYVCLHETDNILTVMHKEKSLVKIISKTKRVADPKK